MLLLCYIPKKTSCKSRYSVPIFMSRTMEAETELSEQEKAGP